MSSTYIKLKLGDIFITIHGHFRSSATRKSNFVYRKAEQDHNYQKNTKHVWSSKLQQKVFVKNITQFFDSIKAL
jgi:hypothetical protein